MKQIIMQKRAEWLKDKRCRVEDNEYCGMGTILIVLNLFDELLAEIKPCVWTMDKSKMWWDTTCGNQYAHKNNFCPCCGNEIEEAGK